MQKDTRLTANPFLCFFTYTQNRVSHPVYLGKTGKSQDYPRGPVYRLRMELAKTLLLEKRKTIYEVTLLTGFKHRADFSIAFKRHFGIPLSDVIH